MAIKWSTSDPSVLAGGTYEVKERPDVAAFPLLPTTSTAVPLRWSKYFDIARMFDKDPKTYQSTIEGSAGVGASPDATYTAYLRMAIGDFSGTGGRVARVQITLEYHTLWTERMDYAAS